MYKKLNPLKSKFFKLITSSFKNYNTPIKSFDNYAKILIIRPNHRLGNQLLLSPLIQEIHNQIPNCEIDLLVNGTLSEVLYKNYNYINTIHNLPKKPFKNLFTYLSTSFRIIRKKYDIGILGCEDSNSGKIFLKLSNCKHKIYNSDSFVINKPIHISKYPIYNFIINQEVRVKEEIINYPKIDLKLSAEELKKGNDILQGLFKKNEKVIAIFTYATGNKIYSKKCWKSFYNILKEEFPNHKILEILPKENISQIDFETTCYYSENLREIASVIENCELFIGADSGMMHLSVSTNTTTIGLFKVTNPDVYGPYGNENLSIITTNLNDYDITKKIKKILTP